MSTRVLQLRVVTVAMLMPLISRLSLSRQERLLEPRRAHPFDPAREAWIANEVDGLLAIGRPLVRPGCLTRGLTHYYFLRRAGVDVRLVYGISAREAEPEGHCWLVRDGEPYLERVDPRRRFLETYSIPRSAAPSVA